MLFPPSPRAPTSAVHAFTTALGQRHGRYIDPNRFDVLDLGEAEIEILAEVVANATCPGDLEVVAKPVARLRLDGQVIGTASFEALVLRGEAPERSSGA